MGFSNLFISFNEDEDIAAVAVSGGIDSLALVFLLRKYFEKKIIALTVDHRLRPTSTTEALYVHDLLEKNGIEHHILTWEGEKPVSNIELIARNKRYELITDFCKKRGIKSLFVAHHLQDQVETFFIRLFRGSGIDGLSSMKQENEINGIKILRPLLEIKKEDLKDFLILNKIEWVEDESNEDEKYLRNKIRKFLNSFDDKNIILKRVNSAINEISFAKSLIEETIERFEKDNVFYNKLGFCKINLDDFLKLEERLSLKILVKYLIKIGGKIYKPRLENLKVLFKKLKEKTCKTETFYNCFLEICNGKLYIYKEFSKIQKEMLLNKDVLWDNRIYISSEYIGQKVESIKEFGFNKILYYQKENNKNIYDKLSKIKGINKKLLLTLPVIYNNENLKLPFDISDIF